MDNHTMVSRRQFTLLLSKLFASLAAFCSIPTQALKRSPLSTDDIADLKSKISGKVIAAGQEDYESWRRNMSWQFLKTSRRPQLMVQAKSSQDVITAVRFANENSLKLSVRTGGHSWVHSSIREGGMLVDLRHFKDIQIDSKNHTAIVGPAHTSRELANALEKEGLAFPVAHCSSVALGGYLLGGGQAWNGESWGGAACNSISALEVVNAQGELIHVDESRHSDLFWAAKGAGPGFPGVVTAYHLNLYPLPQAIHMNTYIWPLTDTLIVSDWLSKVAEELSEKVEVLMFLSGLPEPINGVDKAVIISAVAFADSNEEAASLLTPLSSAQNLSTPLVVEELTPMTFASLFDLVDRSFFPCRAAADTFWFDLSMNAVMENFVEHFASAPSPYSTVLCEVKTRAAKIGNSAYSMRLRTYLSPYAFWLTEEKDEINLQWMKKTQEILAPLSSGHYVNEADLEASPERSERSFSKESWRRIKEVQTRHDPNGIFHSYLGH
jgi:FAD/FMN-containing dehydrogenase